MRLLAVQRGWCVVVVASFRGVNRFSLSSLASSQAIFVHSLGRIPYAINGSVGLHVQELMANFCQEERRRWICVVVVHRIILFGRRPRRPHRHDEGTRTTWTCLLKNFFQLPKIRVRNLTLCQHTCRVLFNVSLDNVKVSPQLVTSVVLWWSETSWHVSSPSFSHRARGGHRVKCSGGAWSCTVPRRDRAFAAAAPTAAVAARYTNSGASTPVLKLFKSSRRQSGASTSRSSTTVNGKRSF